jgi:ankyrin repeat protein
LIEAIFSDWTPLHSACRWNAFDCVEMLLAWGGNVNAVTHGGQTPLHLAAFFGKSRETIQVAVVFLLKVFKVLKNTTP